MFRMLIVDDEQSVAFTLKLVFQREGFEIVTAQSCAEALSIMSDGAHFDVVVTDLNMEREDIGLEVARVAQNLAPRPAVIVCTGYASNLNTEEALRLHVDYLALKPVDITEMKLAIRRLLAMRAGAAGAKN